MKKLTLLFLLAAGLAFADTPPPGAVKLKNSSGSIIDPATEVTLALLNGKVPASPAAEHTTAGSPNSCRLSDGSSFYKGTTPSDTQPVSASSLPLPSGASTSANQTTELSSLASILSALSNPLAVTGTFFQATQPVSISGSVPVTGTFFQATQPVSIAGSVTVTGGLTDTQLRASAVPVSISGTTPVSAASLPLPTGASTSALQSTGNTSLASILSALGSPSQEHITAGSPNASRLTDGTSFYKATTPSDTQPVSAASLPLPSGASTSALQTSTITALGSPFQAGGSIGNTAFGISGTLPAFAATPTFNIGTSGSLALDATLSALSAKFGSLGQKLMSGSAPVVIASDQSAIPVTGTFFQATQPVSGTVAVSNSFALDATLSSFSAKFNSLGQKTMANSAPVVLSSDQSAIPVTGTFFQATQPVSAASLPLPSGAATAAKQPALGTAGSASADVITIQGIASMTAVKVDGSAVTQPVSIASPLQIKAALNTTGSGSAAAATVSTVATLTAPSNAVGFILMNLDTSTTNMRWAVGRTASTTLGQQLQPGRDTGFVPIGANISIIAESGTVNYDVQWVSQ